MSKNIIIHKNVNSLKKKNSGFRKNVMNVNFLFLKSLFQLLAVNKEMCYVTDSILLV